MAAAGLRERYELFWDGEHYSSKKAQESLIPGAVFRAEIAGNDDSWSSWIMIGHPF